jgi:hypothetical protein
MSPEGSTSIAAILAYILGVLWTEHSPQECSHSY